MSGSSSEPARADEPAAPGFHADRILAFLRDPRSHGLEGDEVSLVETHRSWLVFTPAAVLKLLKPAHDRNVQRTTLPARERDARAELTLNNRLAPGVYLGLVAIVQTAQGLRLVDEPAVPPATPVLEWLVHMRRLPEAARLDRRIAYRNLETDDLQPLGGRLARFYAAAQPLRLAPRTWVDHQRREQRINRRVLLDPRWTPDTAAEALDRQDAALQAMADALGERATNGHIVEGHGDLRPEHVFLLDPPVVIDCIEFDRRLLRTDPYDEVAGLGLDCAVAGAPWIAAELHQALVRQLGGEPPPALLRLYVGARALVRARLALGHLADPALAPDPWWSALSRCYLQHALRASAVAGPHAWP